MVAAANGANTTAVFSGIDPRTAHYVYLETLGGGFGGRATKDGNDGVQVHITNTSNLPVESIEMEYPLLVESYELDRGFGRGRTAIAAAWACAAPSGRSATTCIFNGAASVPAQALGRVRRRRRRAGRFLHVKQNDETKHLPTKPSAVSVQAGERIVVESPGAGGYGRPDQRARGAIELDRISGKFSDAYLARYYSLMRAAE